MRIVMPQTQDRNSIVGWTKKKSVHYNKQILNSLITYYNYMLKKKNTYLEMMPSFSRIRMTYSKII